MRSNLSETRISWNRNQFPKRVEKPEEAQRIFNANKDAAYDVKMARLLAAAEQGKKIVIVYQMGKVGSASYTKTLKEVPGLKVCHVHRMNDEHTEYMIARHLQGGALKRAFIEREWQAIADFVKGAGKHIYLLSAMRNPLARNMSAFFQHLRTGGGEDVEALMERFLASYSHEIPEKWFDGQFRDALGIDIFDHPFDRGRGCGGFVQGRYHCLLLTAETDDSKKIEAINTFLGINLKSMLLRNVGAAKDYSETYRKFKDRIRLPASYVNARLDNKVTRYFYTPEQIDDFRAAWI